MKTRDLVQKWFDIWSSGDFLNLPISEDFSHNSPYGTMNGKETYIEIIQANKDKFLGNQFEIHDELYEIDRACVRYTMHSKDFSMEVSEWFFIKAGQIGSIVSYYNIEGEISEERKLSKAQ